MCCLLLPFSPVFTRYEMNLMEITVAGESIKGSTTKQAILDSGTNILLLPSTPYNSLESILLANCTNNNLVGMCGVTPNLFTFGTCFALTDEQLDMYPPLALSLDNGLTLEMSPRDYLVVLTSSPVTVHSL